MPFVIGASSVRAIREAVSAAQACEADRFDEASQRLGTLDQQQLRVILGSIVTDLLEELHPSGLTAADVQEVLLRSVESTATWHPAVDVAAMVAVLMAALGAADSTADSDAAPPLTAGQAGTHGCLLIADLLTTRNNDLEPYLARTFAEIKRSETMEMP